LLCDHRPKLFFNRDVQVQYGIDRDRSIIDFYDQHNLDCHLGLNNFLQTDSERRDGWFDEYYTYLRQPLHLVPEHINTPELKLDLPQLDVRSIEAKV
jgi:deoxyribodipyrimidine photo-lyase